MICHLMVPLSLFQQADKLVALDGMLVKSHAATCWPLIEDHGQRLHATKQKSAISPSSSCGTARIIESSSCSGSRPLTYSCSKSSLSGKSSAQSTSTTPVFS